jgi:putative MFS transporter
LALGPGHGPSAPDKLSNVTPVQRLTLLLDQSPVAAIQRWHWVLSTGGTLLDGFAIFVLGVAMSLIIADFHIDSAVVGLIGASLVLGAVFGAGIGGPAADRLGRKKLMLIDMVIVGAGAATSALANGPAMLFIGQLLVGMGIGIDFPISSSYISEVVPKRCRARMMVATIACQSMGMLLAAAITLVLLKNTDSAQNWRLFLASEGVIALLFFLLRLSEPDSPHWLMARGRFAEAAHALIRIPLSSANLCSRLRGVPETNTLPIRSRKRKHPEFLSGSGQSHGLDGSGCRPSVSQAWFLACWCSSLLFSCRIPVCMFR